MPSMWTDSELPTGLSASRWNKSTQESKSNLYVNHPAYSEMYIVHWCPSAKLMLRLHWNLSRLDSSHTFNRSSFVSPFQPADCQHHFVFEKRPPSSSSLNPASFSSSRKENWATTSCARSCPIAYYTPCRYRGSWTASDGASKGRLQRDKSVCPSTTSFFQKITLSFSPSTFCLKLWTTSVANVHFWCCLVVGQWQFPLEICTPAPRNSLQRCASKTVCAHWLLIYQAAEKLLILLPY